MRKMKTSRISGFYKLRVEERLEKLSDFADLTEEELKVLGNTGALGEIADRMIENVVGTMPLPVGIAVNFVINGKDHLIPMAIEEQVSICTCGFCKRRYRWRGCC